MEIKNGHEMIQNEEKLQAKSHKETQILRFLFIFLLMPIWAQVSAFLLASLVFQFSFPKIVSWLIFWGGWVLAVVSVSYYYGKKTVLQATFSARYGALFIPVIYTLLLWCASMGIAQGRFGDESFGIIFIGNITFLGTNALTALTGQNWLMLFVPLATYAACIIGFALATWRRGQLKVAPRGMWLTVSILLLLGGVAAWQAYQRNQWLLLSGQKGEQINLSEENLTWQYEPFSDRSERLTPLRGDATLQITDDFPRLDGATALFPVYASAVQAIYRAPVSDDERRAMHKIVVSSKTPVAYQRLIDGEVDLIFASAPSQKQKDAAKEKGVEFKLIPIGKEAFVFLVNQKNPVIGLSVEQIQEIYKEGGKINNWQNLGGLDKPVLAFQRNEGSGSQSTMLNKVMKGLQMRKPMMEDFSAGMGGLVTRVANYRNADNALGYSFRYYVTRMNANDRIRLLAINGVEPNIENIRNDRYPFIGDIYMVIARPVSDNTQKLMDWFLSDQGQALLQDVGYVPLREQPFLPQGAQKKKDE